MNDSCATINSWKSALGYTYVFENWRNKLIFTIHTFQPRKWSRRILKKIAPCLLRWHNQIYNNKVCLYIAYSANANTFSSLPSWNSYEIHETSTSLQEYSRIFYRWNLLFHCGADVLVHLMLFRCWCNRGPYPLMISLFSLELQKYVVTTLYIHYHFV